MDVGWIMGATMFVLGGSLVLHDWCWVLLGGTPTKKSMTIVNTSTGTEDGSTSGGH